MANYLTKSRVVLNPLTNKMEYNGFAGQLMSWAILITAYAVVIIGLSVVWTWIFGLIVTRIFKHFKAWETLVAFIWERARRKHDTPNPVADDSTDAP